MAIDYIIDLECEPKSRLTTSGILERLKNRARANEVIRVYRDSGDDRPEEQIGFEVTRRAADGTEHTNLVVATDMLEEAAVLDQYASYCQGCPANRTGAPYGCIGTINYPVSEQAEVWLLEQLPDVTTPGLFLMMMRSIDEMGYSGEDARRLREQPGIFFECPDTLGREYATGAITADVLFEMTFQVGAIQVPHAAMLLLFYGAIPREGLDPERLMMLIRGQVAGFSDEFPFLLRFEDGDDMTVRDLKRFLLALYMAYSMNVRLLLDV